MMQSKKFRHKVTGEIATQIPLMEMNEWEEVRDPRIVDNKKVKKPIQLSGQMFMQSNGDIVYINSAGVVVKPFELNLKISAPKMYKAIIDTHGTKKGVEVRKRAFYAIAKTLEKNQ